MEEIAITIDGKSFNMKVDSSKKELYKLAEQKLNSSIAKLERMSYEGLGGKDIISLVAFEYVVANINLLQQNTVESQEVDDTLDAINKRVKAYLNELV